MNGRCDTDPLDAADDVCEVCGGEFCESCVLRPNGKRRPPVCKKCALQKSGVRGNTKVEARLSKKEIKRRRKQLAESKEGRTNTGFQYFDETGEYDLPAEETDDAKDTKKRLLTFGRRKNDDTAAENESKNDEVRSDDEVAGEDEEAPATLELLTESASGDGSAATEPFDEFAAGGEPATTLGGFEASVPTAPMPAPTGEIDPTIDPFGQADLNLDPFAAPSHEPATASAAGFEPAPNLEPAPEPSFEPAPAPAYEAAPVTSFEPIPEPAYEPEPLTNSEPEPLPSFEPIPEPEPEPAYEPEPAASFDPEPLPSLEPIPEPASEPEPAPALSFNSPPEPDPLPEPTPKLSFNSPPEPDSDKAPEDAPVLDALPRRRPGATLPPELRSDPVPSDPMSLDSKSVEARPADSPLGESGTLTLEDRSWHDERWVDESWDDERSDNESWEASPDGSTETSSGTPDWAQPPVAPSISYTNFEPEGDFTPDAPQPAPGSERELVGASASAMEIPPALRGSASPSIQGDDVTNPGRSNDSEVDENGNWVPPALRG